MSTEKFVQASARFDAVQERFLSGVGTLLRQANESKAESLSEPEPEPKRIDKTDPWPILDESAFVGLPGEFIRSVEPYSEADPVGLLLHTLIGAGVMIGAQPHVLVEHAPHCARTNALLVGVTAGGRKGTAWSAPRYLFSKIDDSFISKRVKSGLSSGEGLIFQVRDPRNEKEPIREGGKRTGDIIGYRDLLTDPGEPDKRLLLIESEFASALTVMEREGNTLSPVLRDMWDHGSLSPLTKKDPIVATGAHAAVIGHITQHELLSKLTTNDRANGVANRFLFALVRQSKFLPSGEGVPPRNPRAVLLALFAHLGESANTRPIDPRCRNRTALGVRLSEAGRSPSRADWRDTGPWRGASASAQPDLCLVRRNRSKPIGHRHSSPHLLAALAIWDYCTASAYHIFGDAVGDPVADRLLRLIKAGPQTDTELYGALGKHGGDGTRKTLALDLLQRLDRVHAAKIETAGRTVTQWHIGNLQKCALCARRGASVGE
jgi:hypothetical protein